MSGCPLRQRADTGLLLLPDASVPFNSEELRGFGADKLILALTSAPKLLALQATTSEVVWTKYLGPVDAKCASNSVEAQSQSPKGSWKIMRCIQCIYACNMQYRLV